MHETVHCAGIVWASAAIHSCLAPDDNLPAAVLRLTLVQSLNLLLSHSESTISSHNAEPLRLSPCKSSLALSLTKILPPAAMSFRGVTPDMLQLNSVLAGCDFLPSIEKNRLQEGVSY